MTNETQAMPIYMDYSATTPVDPRVAEKMIPFITESYGNPASRAILMAGQLKKLLRMHELKSQN